MNGEVWIDKREEKLKKDKENGWRFYLFEQSDFWSQSRPMRLKPVCLRFPFPNVLRMHHFWFNQSLCFLDIANSLTLLTKTQLRVPVYARPPSALCFQRMGYRSHAGGHASTIGYFWPLLPTHDA